MSKECRCAFNVARVLLQVKMAQDSLTDPDDRDMLPVHARAIDSALNDVSVSCGVDALTSRGEVDRALNYLSEGELVRANGALVSSQTALVEDLARCAEMRGRAGRYE